MRRPKRTRWKPALILLCTLVLFGCGPGASTPAGPVFNTLAPGTPAGVASTPTAVQLRPSPAGWIAFIRAGNIWLVHPDGSAPKQITNIDPPAQDLKMAWSTDGQALAYWTAGKLYALDITGLDSRMLAENTGGGFDWSATAHQLIYDTPLTTGRVPTNNGLWVVSQTEGNTRQISEARSDHPAMLSPLWSFDSNRVIFSVPAPGGQSSGPYLLDAVADTVTALPQGTCSWSPVELVIACVSDAPDGRLILLNESGVETKRFALPDSVFHARLGPWSTDGGSLAISYSTDEAGTQLTSDIFALDTGEFRMPVHGRAVSWSPDGRWMAVELPAAAGETGTLQVVNTTSGLASTLGDGASPLWQPAAGLDVTMATAAPVQQDFCMDARVGYMHVKPKGHYLLFCIGNHKYNYGALASGVYLVGPETRYFVYVSNTGYVFAARMGDPALTRIGNVRWFTAVQQSEILDPDFQIRTLPGYPHLIQVYELMYSQKETFTLPKRIYMP